MVPIAVDPQANWSGNLASSTSASYVTCGRQISPIFFSYGRCHGPTYGRLSSPMRVEELLESFFSLPHHVPEHVDSIVVVLGVVLDDLVDGVLELLVVLDVLLGDLVDGVHVLELIVVHNAGIPLSSLFFVHHDDIPLSLTLSIIVPLAAFVILSNLVPLSDMPGREGDDGCRGRTDRALFCFSFRDADAARLVRETTGVGAEPAEPLFFLLWALMQPDLWAPKMPDPLLCI